jgi:hypothetical protein
MEMLCLISYLKNRYVIWDVRMWPAGFMDGSCQLICEGVYVKEKIKNWA